MQIILDGTTTTTKHTRGMMGLPHTPNQNKCPRTRRCTVLTPLEHIRDQQIMRTYANRKSMMRLCPNHVCHQFAPIQDVIYTIIPQGFPGEGEIAILKKAAYGTKQGVRRFYDYNKKVLLHLGLTICPNEPCLFRYIYRDSVCYLLQYVDDALISGETKAIQHLQTQMTKHFQCKFDKPKDFLGLDITHQTHGELTLSMTTFTHKMKVVLAIADTYYGDVVTPGRTDKKINRTDEHEVNNKYRSQVGKLNWLTMGLRYDIAFVTKELSRVLDQPTKVANEISHRALIYARRTKNDNLRFSYTQMASYTPPKTRKKPTDTTTTYDVDSYNTNDGIPRVDDTPQQQEYKYQGEELTLTCLTDIDLAGQPDTRQSISAYTLFLNGALFHWRAHTEKIIIKNTAAGEYIAMSRGNQACKHVREILKFFGNTHNTYYLYTDNQAAEHLATQPNMSDNSRSIDIHHHEIKQDYVEGGMRIGGVSSKDNTANILTKTLQPITTTRQTLHTYTYSNQQ
jgi:hypothetical protein